MNHIRQFPSLFVRRQRGLSLVEILVALVISLFLIAGVIQLFISSKQTYRNYDALSRLQENGRFALEAMSRDIRMASFTGCPRINPNPVFPIAAHWLANVLTNNAATWWTNFGANSVMGLEGNQVFPDPNISFGTGSGDRVNGTDATILIGGGGGGYSINAVDPSAAPPTLTLAGVGNLGTGSILVICDAQQTSIFQVTGLAGTTVSVGGGAGAPGNCMSGWGSTMASDALNPCAGSPYSYATNAIMTDFIPSAYYVGVSTSGTTYSLYRLQMQVTGATTTASMAAQELVEGVQDMQILYGEDTTNPPDGVVDRYLNANNIANWNNVLSVRVNLLLVSLADNLVPTPQQLMFPPEVVDGGGNLTSGTYSTHPSVICPNDRCLRQIFSTTVGIRNRLRVRS
ncbi:PilW family protein [Candidatus Contendibacter odensensis]|uniref:Type IV pilus assembly protein PilW n=1 Tax=Candidatus Contendobacter odensis Run_B_J11 TaxID=1400861 RepID=A0A7U7J4C5_9GAMM|nr:PilW family protein [Candidatus Contendobacter odensis]CDH45107.1 hypothetical protein BN874_2080009 [Candidatus Contendobacter odensis Run_B_J11]